jgi:hypothetical protein
MWYQAVEAEAKQSGERAEAFVSTLSPPPAGDAARVEKAPTSEPLQASTGGLGGMIKSFFTRQLPPTPAPMADTEEEEGGDAEDYASDKVGHRIPV